LTDVVKYLTMLVLFTSVYSSWQLLLHQFLCVSVVVCVLNLCAKVVVPWHVSVIWVNLFRTLFCIIIIIIIFINCNWVVTQWQWLFYMYTNMKKKKKKSN